MSEEHATATFERVWQDVRNRPEAEATATFGTIRGAERSAARAENLPRVDHLLALGEVLGVGGSGEVIAAEQHSLHRTIAVKRPRGTDGVSARLLREARVIGHLEHPNIPPVHFVGSGANDQLLVGLKRVEGETLTERLAREKPGENIDANLDVLIHICNAVGYAHARGIVHLDLKPDNVMTGHYGEVYVLDWGLAAAFREDAAPGVPHVRDEGEVRGTPAFIAPELITQEPVTPATDVYLLGGLLHYFLTHRPPHAGETALEAMRNAYEPPLQRTFPAYVPPHLAEICTRALARDPAQRFADADAFRAALVDFRSRRRSLEARVVAQERVDALLAALGTETSASTVYQAYGAARQALDEAERVAAERGDGDDDIGRLLQGALEAVIGWELDRENAGGAQLLLEELPYPNEELRARAEALRARQARALEELVALRHEVDLNVGAGSKALLALAIGLTVGAVELVAYLAGVARDASSVLVGYLVYLAILSVTTYLLRGRILQTMTNRSLTLVVWQLSLYGLALRIGGYAGVMPVHATLGYDLALVTLGGLYVGVAIERRVLATVPIYAVATALCFGLPDIAPVIFGSSHFVGLATLAGILFWGRQAHRRAAQRGPA